MQLLKPFENAISQQIMRACRCAGTMKNLFPEVGVEADGKRIFLFFDNRDK